MMIKRRDGFDFALFGALVLSLSLSLVACNGELGSSGGITPTQDSGVPASDLDNSDMLPNWTPTPGNCPSCTEQKEGMGGVPFDTVGNESEFVTRDTDGSLIIDKKNSKFNRYLWVADTNLPGVVKIDLQTNKIVGRYYTGGASTSRTTVNVLGEVFIGSRTAGNYGKYGVTKVLPDGPKCPDTNKDGKITTSSGPDNVLPYGQDDCVAWHVELDGDIRGLAAEDISGITNNDVCKGFQGQKEFNPKKITTQDKHYVWAGGIHGYVYKLDADTGKLLIKTKAPNSVYGMALSQGDNKLWVGAGGGDFGFIDITKCADQTSCDAATVCTQSCTATVCGNSCDGATKATYSGVPGGYGITVDYKKRVWRSGYPTAGVLRYDPYAAVNTRLKFDGTANALGGGIAADADGFIWAANYKGTGLARVHGDTMASVNIATGNSKGVAVGSQGNVYAVQYTGSVHIIKPGPTKTLSDYTITANAIPLKGTAYAYSDMTGVQARLASNDPGWYRKSFTPCLYGGEVKWKYLKWDVEAPTGTWAMFNVRSADTVAGLKQASWYTVACITPPGGQGFVDMSYIKSKVMEVEVRFVASGDMNNVSTVKSARIKTFSLFHQCLKVD
jgi:hypothetical protein